MHRSTGSESEISAASQESGYNTMVAPNYRREDSMPIPIPRTSSTGSSIGGKLANVPYKTYKCTLMVLLNGHINYRICDILFARIVNLGTDVSMLMIYPS